nr:uncharacterized protein LOC127071543 isoform X2 [Vespula vulgaris]
MLASIIFQLNESSIITGIDIGNYRSCVVIVTASTLLEPDTWIPVVQHQFMTNDEAANGKFKDQVQLFTKRDLNPDILKTKFDRIKVTCMQSANLRELFGLMFFIAKTEVIIDLGIDVFGRFKLKQKDQNNEKTDIDKFKEKCLKMINNKTKPDPMGDLLKKVKESGMLAFSKRQEEEREPMKRPLLEKLEAGKADEVFGKQNKVSDNTINKNTLTTDVAIANATGIKDKQNENVKRTLEKSEAGKADEVFGKRNKVSDNTINKNTLTTDVAIANATGIKDKQNENVKRTLEKLEAGKADEVFGKQNKASDNTINKNTLITDVVIINATGIKDKQNENVKRTLEKLEAGKADEVFGKRNKVSDNTINKNTLTTDVAIANATGIKDKQNENVKRTPFGDVVPSSTQKKDKTDFKNGNCNVESKKRSLTLEEKDENKKIKKECPRCSNKSDDKSCFMCGRLPQPKPLPSTTKVKKNKSKKLFKELLRGISFSLSGYVNPQRDEIRKKALSMGARYIGIPSESNACSHLICAFRNTPKYLQLRNYSKIVSHMFIEDCYNKRKRFPWRRYALDNKEKKKPESEDEIEAYASPEETPNPFEEDTDSETYY